MNRHIRRAAQAGTRRNDKLMHKVQALPAGPWHRLEREELQERLDVNLLVQNLKGTPSLKGSRIAQADRGWWNNHYSVLARTLETRWGKIDHLWVGRTDMGVMRNWRAMQDVKNELVENGRERTAVEVYPPEDEVMDRSNWYHLWVLPLGFDLPFSLTREE